MPADRKRGAKIVGKCHGTPLAAEYHQTEAIESQVERFAPGFREIVLGRNVQTAVMKERDNPNLVGGDINGGSQDWRQLFFRPRVALDPYATPVAGLYLCSSATPPGGSVHCLCGYFGARAALRGMAALQAELSLPAAASVFAARS